MIFPTEQCASHLEPLTRTADNAAMYAALMAAGCTHEICEQFGSTVPGYRLIRVDDRLKAVAGNDFEIALVDDSSKSIAYYAKVTSVDFPCIGDRTVVRHQIWRSADIRHTQALLDISQGVLFSYLVKHYDILLDEAGITGGGRFYWSRQISRAIDDGLDVYLYEPATRALRPIPTQSVLNGIENQNSAGSSQDPLLALISSCTRQTRRGKKPQCEARGINV
ncbi:MULTISPECIES: hypothetical protein [Pseudomonas]|uniref:hypothetical protein n=1 Tax=Pseudomonas TaxID=286 RepID=UPI00037EA9C0|nr:MULTISPECIES: hypothetical protein [Pseudomonas]MDH0572768.1 hypothetical protein [Pseudomonas fulva]